MGGRAFPDVKPVSKDRIIPIIEWFQRELGGFRFKTLGSTGKKDFSGDIDIGIQTLDGFIYDFKDRAQCNSGVYVLCVRLTKLLGASNVIMNETFKQIYTRWDIDGDPVQVDFMLGDADLLSFTHWSPDPNTSQYSGAHRTEYLKAIAKALSITFTHDDRVVARVGYTLHHDKGLEYSARWCKPRVDGSGYVVKMTSVSNDLIPVFNQHFPDLAIKANSSSELFSNPMVICERLFEHGVTPMMVNSYEQIADLVKNNHHLYTHRDLIWRLYTERLVEIKQPIPVRLI